MRINEIKAKPLEGDWVVDGHVCEESHADLRISLREYNKTDLVENTYKDLAAAIDPGFLSQGIRAEALDGIQLMNFNDGMMNFLIHSSEHSDNDINYECSIKWDEWDDVGQDGELTPIEKARLLLWVGNIRLHCTDPSFLYWGYQYILTELDSAIYPEDRFPKIRNPQLKGIVCKHLNRILRVLPFYSGEIAQQLQGEFGGPTTGIQAAINRRERVANQNRGGSMDAEVAGQG